MLNTVVENYIKKVQEEILKPNMNDVPLAYLMQQNIPESIKHYFDQEVENWIIEEESKFESSERFDYDIPEVRMKVDEIFDMLKNTATFSKNQFNSRIERAVKLEMAFTVKPQQTMRQFMFKDAKEIRTKEVIDLLRYFNVHNYYEKKFSDYFNMKYMQRIHLEQFKELVAQIDSQVFDANLKEESIKLVQAISSFIQKGTKTNKIPLENLVEAFEDRNLEEYTNLFKSLVDKGITELTLPEIEEAIENSDKTIDHEDKENVQLDSIDVSDVQMKVQEEEEDEEDEDYDDEEDISDEEKSEAIGDQMADYLAQNKTNKPLQDLNILIDKKTKKMFYKKIFKKDQGLYNEIIGELNEMTEWKDASELIEDIFYEKDINPYSKEATIFSDLVYNRFFPDDEYVG